MIKQFHSWVYSSSAISNFAPNWNQPKCSLAGEWTNKLWYIHRMEYYSRVQKGCLIHVTTKMKAQRQHAEWKKPFSEGYILWSHLYDTRKDKSIGIDNGSVVTKSYWQRDSTGGFLERWCQYSASRFVTVTWNYTTCQNS